jgi:hypothetical protein
MLNGEKSVRQKFSGDNMIVVIPPEYADVVAKLHDPSKRFFHIKNCGDHFEMEVKTSMSFNRVALGLTRKRLGSFFSDIKVVGGVKKKSREHIIFEPKRPLTVTIRFSNTELSLIKEAARKNAVTLSDFIRSCVLDKVFAPEGGGAA